MNFYKHYIGDFQRDTNHLSLTERGAYLALMHHYYATETPLPVELDQLCRIAGAITSAERKAVKVAMGFFDPTDSGLTHDRIEAELEKAGQRSNTNREIALAREAKRRAEREAREQHESCTKRAPDVSRTEGELSSNQTPDAREEQEEPNGSLSAKADTANCPHNDIIALYHEILPANPRIKVWDGARADSLRARWREDSKRQDLDYWRRYFAHVSASPFLTGKVEGQGGRPFLPGLDWLVKASNFAKVIEGRYHERAAA